MFREYCALKQLQTFRHLVSCVLQVRVFGGIEQFFLPDYISNRSAAQPTTPWPASRIATHDNYCAAFAIAEARASP
jgi:hypothetical protein